MISKSSYCCWQRWAMLLPNRAATARLQDTVSISANLSFTPACPVFDNASDDFPSVYLLLPDHRFSPEAVVQFEGAK